MFTSARSYLSRFSSLILFVLAVFIVGYLLIMTISSAGNNDSDTASTNSTATSSTESNLTYDQVEVESESESESEVEGVSSSQTVSVESSASTSTSYSTGNPQTLAVTEVNLDSQDSVSINTTTTDDSGRVDASGSGMAVNTAVLPDTGPSSIISVAIALIVTILGLTYWNRSRQDLNRQLLITNR